MVLDHGLRPWSQSLFKGFSIKRESERDWTSLGFRSEILGSQGVGVDPALVNLVVAWH